MRKWTITPNERQKNLENVVDYLVLAEFDIDSGSTVRHQYPSAILNYNEDWLAENMLPEGSHNRETDWTYILLNRNESNIYEVRSLNLFPLLPTVIFQIIFKYIY